MKNATNQERIHRKTNWNMSTWDIKTATATINSKWWTKSSCNKRYFQYVGSASSASCSKKNKKYWIFENLLKFAYSTSKFPLNGCNNQEVLENRSRICGLHPRIYMQDLAKKMILNRFPAPSKQEPWWIDVWFQSRSFDFALHEGLFDAKQNPHYSTLASYCK